MGHTTIRRVLIISTIAIFSLAVTACLPSSEDNDDLQHIRLGWQIPLATQGQIVQVLKRTDILEEHGFSAEFVPFSFGSPQVEAARSGNLDVIFVGDQPALNLIASGADWRLTSVLFETQVAVMTQPGSEVGLNDLEGARLASPFGSVAHREAILLEQRLGLDPETDVQNLNVDILEIAALVQSNRNWNAFDAIAVWEPSVTLFEQRGYAIPLEKIRTLGVAAASNAFLSDPDAATRLEAAIEAAWAYFLNNTAEVNQWYIDDTGLDYTQDFLTDALLLDRNGRGSPDQIDLSFTPQDIETLDNGIRWAFNQGYIRELVPATDVIYTEH